VKEADIGAVSQAVTICLVEQDPEGIAVLVKAWQLYVYPS